MMSSVLKFCSQPHVNKPPVVLVTGATGFIGRALCSRLASDNKVIGVYRRNKPVDAANVFWERADLTDGNSAAAICEKYSPAVVVHCAGLAHQKIGAVDLATYMRVNSEATENLARAASKGNPAVRFIFLSSVSVYGEGPAIRQKEKNTSRPSTICRTYGVNKGAKAQERKNYNGIGEESECQPTSDYAVSKLDAEKRLVALSDEGIIGDLIILRLAPVYDRDWSFNLDRRVLAPLNMAYIRFGSGLQKMSALARPNLVDFVGFLIHRLRPGEICSAFHRAGKSSQIDIDKYPQIAQINADENNIKKSQARQNNLCNQRNLRINIFNVCDAEAYEFNKVIRAFKNSDIRPGRPVISVSLPVVWLATRIAGSLSPDKRDWLHSCYDKLASSMVFSNEKMLKTGFEPVHSLETIFPSTRKI